MSSLFLPLHLSGNNHNFSYILRQFLCIHSTFRNNQMHLMGEMFPFTFVMYLKIQLKQSHTMSAQRLFYMCNGCKEKSGCCLWHEQKPSEIHCIRIPVCPHVLCSSLHTHSILSTGAMACHPYRCYSVLLWTLHLHIDLSIDWLEYWQ